MNEKTEIKQGEQPYKLFRDILVDSADEFWHLERAKVKMFWVEPNMESQGIITMASVKLVSGIWRQLTSLDFLLMISKECWESLKAAEKKALMKHEMRHMDVKRNGNGIAMMENGSAVTFDDDNKPFYTERLKYISKPHDLHLFAKDITVDRCAYPGLELVVKAFRQLEFDFEAGAAGKTEKKTEPRGRKRTVGEVTGANKKAS